MADYLAELCTIVEVTLVDNETQASETQRTEICWT